MKMGTHGRSGAARKPNETMRLLVTTVIGVVFGFFIGVSFPITSVTKFNPANFIHNINFTSIDHAWYSVTRRSSSSIQGQSSYGAPSIWVPTNPRGAERLPPGIVEHETDFYPRRLWGKPSEDLIFKPRYLVTFTVGLSQKSNIDAAVKKFSENFQILLFHYDGKVSEWDDLEWSKHAIHVSVRKQTKWWYAKRFLHPSIVAAYDYIFVWDEDLGVEHFDAEEYIKLVRKHGLEISQPGLEPNSGLTWQMTKKRDTIEVHKETEERAGWCTDPRLPPCAAFVEIMATVFSRDAWRCVWYMIQNDLVHGWGLDFALRKCVEPAHEKIGVVDAQSYSSSNRSLTWQSGRVTKREGAMGRGKRQVQKRVDHVSRSNGYSGEGISQASRTTSTTTLEDKSLIKPQPRFIFVDLLIKRTYLLILSYRFSYFFFMIFFLFINSTYLIIGKEKTFFF